MGGVTSHAALLSRSLKIPAVVGLKDVTSHAAPDDFMILDGYSGVIVINPAEETIANYKRRSREMAKIGLHVLEQPVPANDFLGLRDLVARSAVPIAVDESVFCVGDLEQLIGQKALNMLVIKVSKMAGLSGARECIERALDAGIELLGSGLTETRLGLAASSHLYSAFGFKYPVDLNGPQFLADDPVKSGVSVVDAAVRLADSPGIGIEVDEEKLAHYGVRI